MGNVCNVGERRVGGGMPLASGASPSALVVVVVIGVGMLLLRQRLARGAFGVLAYMNDPRTDGKRWKRDNADHERYLRIMFGLAGAFVLEAALDALGVISL